MSEPTMDSESAADNPVVDAAIRRLVAALDTLESVVERRQEGDRGQDAIARRIQTLGVDRSRLADELDGSLARARTLEAANRDIALRLDGAIETIRTVLKAQAS
jgi:hypothetical protein